MASSSMIPPGRLRYLFNGFDSQSLLKQLFPDQETFRKEEQRRFEILAGHWDVPVGDVDLEK